jgi:hypothetical protein
MTAVAIRTPIIGLFLPFLCSPLPQQPHTVPALREGKVSRPRFTLHPPRSTLRALPPKYRRATSPCPLRLNNPRSKTSLHIALYKYIRIYLYTVGATVNKRRPPAKRTHTPNLRRHFPPSELKVQLIRNQITAYPQNLASYCAP